MTKEHEIIVNKLLYFAKIGESFNINAEDFEIIVFALRRNKRNRRFRYQKLNNNQYQIWRTK